MVPLVLEGLGWLRLFLLWTRFGAATLGDLLLLIQRLASALPAVTVQVLLAVFLCRQLGAFVRAVGPTLALTATARVQRLSLFAPLTGQRVLGRLLRLSLVDVGLGSLGPVEVGVCFDYVYLGS